MKYSTFVIDLDQTLFDSDDSKAVAFAQTMNAAGVSDPGQFTRIYQRISVELWAAVERGETAPQQVQTRRFERLEADVGLDADLYNGARGVIEQLSEHAA